MLVNQVILALSFVLLIGACAPVSPTAKQDRELFERLCNAADRDVIKRTALVPGYVVADDVSRSLACPGATKLKESLFKDKYQYYECVIGPWQRGRNNAIETFRFELKPKGEPSCTHPKLTIHENVVASWQEQYNLPGEVCIGVTQYSRPRSRYMELKEHGGVAADGSHNPSHAAGYREIPGYISYSRTRVIDMRADETIAEFKAYAHYPAGAQFMDITKEYCKKRGDSQKQWQISDVLIPKK